MGRRRRRRRKPSAADRKHASFCLFSAREPEILIFLLFLLPTPLA